MKSKIGRDQLCWCGSEKKYEHCHLNRENDTKLNRQDFEAHSKKNGSYRKCSAKGIVDECSGNIVKAHTISKSGSLKTIAVDSHVMGTKVNLSELHKSQGKVTLHRVGINTASTFTGFCAHHDKTLFAPLEDHPIVLNDEQLFLLAYRSIARELFAKEISANTADFMHGADRGHDPFLQVMMQYLATEFSSGVDLALKELQSIKAKMDGMLAARDFSKLKHFVIEFSQQPEVLVSATTQPDFDFDGEKLQDFGSTDIEMSHIIFNSIAYDNRGAFVFTWIEEHGEICRKFIESLAKLDEKEMANALIRFSYSYAENTWASPNWWDSIGSEVKKDISDRLQHGLMTTAAGSFLRPNSIDFNACVIESFGYH
jgi:hypothetical protein